MLKNVCPPRRTTVDIIRQNDKIKGVAPQSKRERGAAENEKAQKTKGDYLCFTIIMDITAHR